MSAYPLYTSSGIFVDPTTDPGFKILFGREASKDILVALLNVILEKDLESPIKSVSFMDKEKLRQYKDERTVIFDLHCLTDDGKRMIIEMQNAPQEWFVERTLLYAERAISDQSRSGDWDYHYMPVISIAFTNFTLPNFKGQAVIDSSIVDKYSGRLVTDRLRLIYIQMPEFIQMNPGECRNELEKWVYTIKNMGRMENIPFAATDYIFRRVEELARKANLSPEEQREYERNEKAYRDHYNRLQYAKKSGLKQGIEKGLKQGLEQGLEQGRRQEQLLIARNMLDNGLPDEIIAQCTGLPLVEIREIVRVR